MKSAQILKPDAVLVDLDLGAGPTGMDLAIALRRNFPSIGIVILTTFEDPRLLHPKIPNPPIGTEYLVKREVGDVNLLYNAILKSIQNVYDIINKCSILNDNIDYEKFVGECFIDSSKIK